MKTITELPYQPKDTFDYIVVQGKIEPAFRNGFTFGRRQAIGCYDELRANKVAADYCVKKKVKTAVYKTRYSCPLSQITHLELLTIFEPQPSNAI